MPKKDRSGRLENRRLPLVGKFRREQEKKFGCELGVVSLPGRYQFAAPLVL